MENYALKLIDLSDEQLLAMVDGPQPGSQNHESLKFEFQRRAVVAQRQAAVASARAATAAERYTRATYILIIVTVIVSIAGNLTQFATR